MDGDRLVCGSYAEPWNKWRTAWGGELVPALRLPSSARGLVVVGGGDIIVAFGGQVARFRPPAS
ncbi:hypothetical protein [Paractinoplanes atraurantiacus]|uniref:hypothetical protein n=1 Tax=Paractinoplanes atraurantiacus TaxID=1036182 RepID=UPI0011777A09|nr:hypothetical protein [Actinoplanes atraurantiacus]